MNSHFDNPLVEQRELLEGSRVVVLDDRKVIKVSGADRLTWLHAMLSQNIANLKPGQSADALLLDANGRIEENLQIIEDGENAWLIVYAEHFDKLLAWFDQMIFRSKVSVAAADELVVVGGFGEPLAGAAISNEVQLVWVDPWMSDPVGSVLYAADVEGRGTWNYWLALVSKAALDDILAEQGNKLDAVVQLTADTDEVVRRLLNRAVEQGRADDTEEVIRRRLEVYEEQTAPLTSVYAQRGLVIMIDGLGAVEEVTERILQALEARGLDRI